jgi:hypothetical protein
MTTGAGGVGSGGGRDAAGSAFDLGRLHPRLAEEYRALAMAEADKKATPAEPSAGCIGALAFLMVFLVIVLRFTPVWIILAAVVGAVAVAQPVVRHAHVKRRKRHLRDAALRDTATLKRLLPTLPCVKAKEAEAERGYVEVVRALLDAEGLDAATVGTILTEANGLLDDAIALRKRRELIARASDGHSAEWRRAEVRSLEKRVAAATDPGTRAALQQSLDLSRETLRATEELAVAAERVEAQQEAILRAFTSLRALLGRLAIATAPLAAPGLDQMRSLTANVHDQTRAVEQAVQEVLNLRAGS